MKMTHRSSGTMFWLLFVLVLGGSTFFLLSNLSQPAKETDPLASVAQVEPNLTPTLTLTPTLSLTLTPTATPTPTIASATLSPSPTTTPPPPCGEQFGYCPGKIVSFTPPEVLARRTPFVTSTPTPIPTPAVRVVSDEFWYPPAIAAKFPAVDNWIDLITLDPPDKIVMWRSDRHTDQPAERWAYTPGAETLEPSTWTYPFPSVEVINEVIPYFSPSFEGRNIYGVIKNAGRLSPDGHWLVVGSRQTLLLKQVDSPTPALDLDLKADHLWLADTRFAWSPQSDKFAYVVKLSQPSVYEIRIASTTGDILARRPLWDASPYDVTWSPDGRYLIFICQIEHHNAHQDVYLMRADGTGFTQLTSHGYVEGRLVWFPDNQQFLYYNDSDVFYGIYKIRLTNW